MTSSVHRLKTEQELAALTSLERSLLLDQVPIEECPFHARLEFIGAFYGSFAFASNIEPLLRLLVEQHGDEALWAGSHGSSASFKEHHAFLGFLKFSPADIGIRYGYEMITEPRNGSMGLVLDDVTIVSSTARWCIVANRDIALIASVLPLSRSDGLPDWVESPTDVLVGYALEAGREVKPSDWLGRKDLANSVPLFPDD